MGLAEQVTFLVLCEQINTKLVASDDIYLYSQNSVGQKSIHTAVQLGPQLTRLKNKVLTKLGSYVKALGKISLPSSFRV